ncbi:MAG: phosphatase PAP2 family protein [Thermoleophilia bacterium]
MPELLPLWVRVLALVVGLALWLAQYFAVNHVQRPVRSRVRLESSLDRSLPVVPQFVVFYLSTYLLGVLPPLFVVRTNQFIDLAIAYGVITVVSTAVHVLYPSEIVRLDARSRHGWSWRLIDWFQRLCRPYGNFPSVHAGFAALAVVAGFTALGVALGVTLLAWAVLVIISTLLIRQHYVVDVVVGVALGGVVTAALLLGW